MKTVISARDIEDLLRSGGDVSGLPADAIYTPSARDLLADLEKRTATRKAAPEQAGGPAPAQPSQQLSSRSPKGELDAFFNSPYARRLKEQICDVGRRLWQRAYVDGNGGNMSIRVGEDLALCTPTLVSKGFMTPDDMCLVDFEGTQLAGTKKRTSEILMHLQIYQRQPRAAAAVHAHPPYSTGFAVAGVEPPTCMIPEFEVFASVALAPYRTPGTPEMGKLVADLVDQHNIVLMANHGVVCWSHLNVEDAYFKMEILEAYCRTVLVASQLGKPVNTMTAAQVQDLLKIKQGLQIPDPRYGLREADLCDNSEWRPGTTCSVPPRPDAGAAFDPDAEAIVQAITDRIMAELK